MSAWIVSNYHINRIIAGLRNTDVFVQGDMIRHIPDVVAERLGGVMAQMNHDAVNQRHNKDKAPDYKFERAYPPPIT